MQYLISNSAKIPEYKEIILTTIDKMLTYFSDVNIINVDTETQGFDPYTDNLIFLQLGDLENQFCIDIKTVDINIFKSLLEHKDKLFLFQNFQFDGRFLLHNNIDITNIYDTFLAECLLTAGYAKDKQLLSLDSLVKKYLGIYMNKSIRKTLSNRGLSEDVIKYSCDDVKYLNEIRIKQLTLIDKWELSNILDIENKAVRVFAKMLYKGTPFNPDKWMQVADETENNVNILIEKLDSIIYNIGSKEHNKITKYCIVDKQQTLDIFDIDIPERKTYINWSSNKEKKEILKDLNIKVDNVSEQELQKVKTKHILISLLIDYSKQSKLKTSFGKDFLSHINPITKRIHPTVWQILSTGRISVYNPNLNQIPAHGNLAKKIRASIEAPKGYKIIGGDYSGFELRIIAEFSKDPLWLDIFKKGKDLHSILCSKTFNIPLDKVREPFPPKPSFTYRDVQKTIDFGLAYGMSKFKLSETMQIDVGEAEKIITKFFSIVPDVEKFLNRLKQIGTTKGYIRTPNPFRRVRWFTELKDAIIRDDNSTIEAIGRKAKNTPIQATNANIIKIAMILLQNEIDTNSYPMQIILQVYDELQTICEESFAYKGKEILENVMIEAGKKVLTSVPVVIDCKISDYWMK